MTQNTDINFTDNANVKGRDKQFINVTIKLAPVVKSWKSSVFSFEWLNADGDIKDMGNLSPAEQAKRKDIETALNDHTPIEMPVLGIGILDNIEIGSGRAALLTLAAGGIEEMPVHIPKSCESDFKSFRADIDS